MGPQHIATVAFVSVRPRMSIANPIKIDIPSHSALAASIAAARVGNMAFLITKYGKPFTANSFGNKFKPAGLINRQIGGLVTG